MSHLHLAWLGRLFLLVLLMLSTGGLPQVFAAVEGDAIPCCTAGDECPTEQNTCPPLCAVGCCAKLLPGALPQLPPRLTISAEPSPRLAPRRPNIPAPDPIADSIFHPPKA
jgi:hypothetical protein